MGEVTEICGTLEKQIYKNPENGYSVFVLKVNSKESITVQGCFSELHQGEQATFKGKWVFHPKFGKQFHASECSAQLPNSIVGIKKYLSSGLIKGIGPKFAERLVNKFGEQTLEIIDKNPNRLFEVAGVGEKRVFTITQAWLDQKEISKVMVFLKSKDITTSFAVKIYKTYGNKAIETIQENPYRLVEEIWGVGFKTADQLAIKLGLEKTAPQRINSGILHCLTQATNNGHLYLEVTQAKKEVVKILELEEENLVHQSLIKQSLHQLYEKDKIKLITHNEQHFLSLPQYYFSEKGISNKILKFLDKKVENKKFDFDEVYNQIRKPDSNGMELNEDQQRGILSCLQNIITIITGGPGTGKTTLIKKLLEVLETNRIKFRLAAPTGRAAKRMFEGTHRNTETLHRLLEFNPSIMNFNKNEQNALDLDFLIVDEASMIDVFLMHSILKALPSKAHLVLLGDVDQLPSVGAGNVLNDFINSEKIATTRLTQIFRQAQDSLIIVNAHRVNKGEFPTSFIEGSKKDFIYIKEDEPEDIFPLLHKIYKVKLPQRGILPSDAVVLTPMNRGIAGTQRLNQELQMILNPAQSEKQVSRFGQVYKIGDRVMQIRNNYDKFVFNGDMGTIQDIDLTDQKILINFGDRALEYDFTELDELVLSYAISIHKSQGSEFQAVIIPIFMQHFILLQRNLIYTAITRAKKLCILIGQAKAIAMGIKNNKGIKRNTFLKEFLTTDLESR